MLTRLAVALVLAASLNPTPALAEKDQAPNTSTGDPNERICENITLTGSRLATKRFCGTRAEWEEQRRQDRQAVDQIQKQIAGPCSVVANKNTGAPSC